MVARAPVAPADQLGPPPARSAQAQPRPRHGEPGPAPAPPAPGSAHRGAWRACSGLLAPPDRLRAAAPGPPTSPARVGPLGRRPRLSRLPSLPAGRLQTTSRSFPAFAARLARPRRSDRLDPARPLPGPGAGPKIHSEYRGIVALHKAFFTRCVAIFHFNSLIQQRFIEHLLHARNCSKHWADSSWGKEKSRQTPRNPCPHGRTWAFHRTPKLLLWRFSSHQVVKSRGSLFTLRNKNAR